MYDLFAQLATINNDQGYLDVQTMETVPSNERKLKCPQMIQTSMKTPPEERRDASRHLGIITGSKSTCEPGLLEKPSQLASVRGHIFLTT